MRRHRRFEFLAGEYLKQEGYQTEVTQGTADWGVDVFAEKDGIKYVVQAKMYGDCKTKINRSMMMELYGVMHYFDCQGAILIYRICQHPFLQSNPKTLHYTTNEKIFRLRSLKV